MPRRFDMVIPPDEGVMKNPLDRYSQLPPPTRKFFEQLREEDLDELSEAIRFMRSVKTVGRFTKWVILTSVGIFIATVQFGEAILKALNWMQGGGRP